MSVHTHATRRTAAPVVAALAVLFLAPTSAVADPPALNRDSCSVFLAPAVQWPGGFAREAGTYRLVSDGYVSHLSAQPACTSPES